MRHANILSMEGQFKLSGRLLGEPPTTPYQYDFALDEHAYYQANIVKTIFDPAPIKWYIDRDAGVSGPSIGLGMLMVAAQLVDDFVIADRYVFSGVLDNWLQVKLSGSLKEKLPYLTKDQCVVTGLNPSDLKKAQDGTLIFRGGVLNKDNHIIYGDTTSLHNYFGERHAARNQTA